MPFRKLARTGLVLVSANWRVSCRTVATRSSSATSRAVASTAAMSESQRITRLSTRKRQGSPEIQPAPAKAATATRVKKQKKEPAETNTDASAQASAGSDVKSAETPEPTANAG